MEGVLFFKVVLASRERLSLFRGSIFAGLILSLLLVRSRAARLVVETGAFFISLDLSTSGDLPGAIVSAFFKTCSSSMIFLASATEITRPVFCFSSLILLWISAKFCLSLSSSAVGLGVAPVPIGYSETAVTTSVVTISEAGVMEEGLRSGCTSLSGACFARSVCLRLKALLGLSVLT